jgi:hypothetical protein
MMAWFSMSPVTVASTFTRKATDTCAPMARAPPIVPFAPVPRRTRTVRDAAM